MRWRHGGCGRSVRWRHGACGRSVRVKTRWLWEECEVDMVVVGGV